MTGHRLQGLHEIIALQLAFGDESAEKKNCECGTVAYAFVMPKSTSRKGIAVDSVAAKSMISVRAQSNLYFGSGARLDPFKVLSKSTR